LNSFGKINKLLANENDICRIIFQKQAISPYYMINFYPGPSKIYPAVKEWLLEAYDSGILERNHRSNVFMELMANTIQNLKIKLEIPADYEVFFTSSATECWEIVNQSLMAGKTHFFYNGAFGKKWFKYGVTNQQKAVLGQEFSLRGSRFLLNESIENCQWDDHADTLCLVQNETSNGTYVPNESLQLLRSFYPNACISIDATSSMAGVATPWLLADCWFASVQKCFGLPAGMAIMVASPRAIERAKMIDERNHYNSFLEIRQNFRKRQTPYTPNILGCFLLHKFAETVAPIAEIHEKTTQRANDFYDFLENKTTWKPLIEIEETRSATVFAVTGSSEEIKKIKLKATENDILLGNGYGEWLESTFRIANFPAIDDNDFDVLKDFLL
jgi:phosphoserine aminotransferase